MQTGAWYFSLSNTAPDTWSARAARAREESDESQAGRQAASSGEARRTSVGMGLEDVLDREALGSNVVEDLLQMSRAIIDAVSAIDEAPRASCATRQARARERERERERAATRT